MGATSDNRRTWQIASLTKKRQAAYGGNGVAVIRG